MAATAIRLDPEYDELLRLFAAECDEGLGAMEQSLLSLESGKGGSEPLNLLFRMAHTLKGNASSLGLSELVEFSHALEDVLERLRARELEAGPEVIATLLASVDALREMVPAAVEARR
ncbi:MAG TPA: Hpt domain-containing protein [Vicinamibacteria bacterium]|nr:Hpt domain-containing protein [Vicinamibacteria bacterium]